MAVVDHGRIFGGMNDFCLLVDVDYYWIVDRVGGGL